MTLVVTEIFDSLQGEGFWTGVPMTFVRLAGCNAPEEGLACLEWCDTPAGWDSGAGRRMEVGEILAQVHLPRLCLTGGEPLLQLEAVAHLVKAAERRELRLHLETNGTIDPGEALCTDAGIVWATVSPKPPDYRVAPGWEGLMDELKLVAEETLAAATAERLAEAYPGAIVSIQPCWTEPAATIAAGATEAAAAAADRAAAAAAHDASIRRALALVMAHPEWRLSLQTHKYLGIR